MYLIKIQFYSGSADAEMTFYFIQNADTIEDALARSQLWLLDDGDYLIDIQITPIPVDKLGNYVELDEEIYEHLHDFLT